QRRREWRHRHDWVGRVLVRRDGLGIFWPAIYRLAILLPNDNHTVCVVGNQRGQPNAGFLRGDHEYTVSLSHGRQRTLRHLAVYLLLVYRGAESQCHRD